MMTKMMTQSLAQRIHILTGLHAKTENDIFLLLMFHLHFETETSHLFPALLDSSARSCLVVLHLKEAETDVENNKSGVSNSFNEQDTSVGTKAKTLLQYSDRFRKVIIRLIEYILAGVGILIRFYGRCCSHKLVRYAVFSMKD